jgi:hypothetical protein
MLLVAQRDFIRKQHRVTDKEITQMESVRRLIRKDVKWS